MTSPLTTETASLDDVLAYRHPGVLRRYRKERNATAEEADDVFREMLKWLFLCRQAATEGVACAITPEIEKIDEMWHAFLLYTADYADFCADHFGLFLHHEPSDEDGPSMGDEELRGMLERQFGLVYDVLGEETLAAWYEECRYAAPAGDDRGPAATRDV